MDFLWEFPFSVSGYCESRGWKRIYNKHREDFKLKWCETKAAANYYNFREGSVSTLLISIINSEDNVRSPHSWTSEILIVFDLFNFMFFFHVISSYLLLGEQLLYQIPNNNVLTTKIGLLSSLREYERVSSRISHGQGLR